MTLTNEAALEALLRVLDLESLGGDRFRGDSVNKHWRRVYGGQVVAQALMAAFRTVEDRIAHSLHGYFVRMGNPNVPIDYAVTRVRDGKSFSTRSVAASQGEDTIFIMAASFHNGEEGLEHQAAMPAEVQPEALPDEDELERLLKAKYSEKEAKLVARVPPIEFRPIDIERFLDRPKQAAEQNVWMRIAGTLADGPMLHQVLVAYMSDYSLIDTALVGHGRSLIDPSLQVASIDHALWFHRPGRADDWLLYVQDSPSASGARGFCRGSIYARNGRLIASAAQEGLMRKRPPKVAS